jgi:hypothetical protein
MYDDEDDEENGGGKFVKNIAKGTAGGVKRVARGTRRMSLLATTNVKNVAGGVAGTVKNAAVNMPNNLKHNVKKVADGTVNVGKNAVDGAKNVMKVKKKKKKKDRKSSSKKRGRSESPKRNNNSSKPPVTKPGVLRTLFSPKRWRSSSPASGRRGGKYESDSEADPRSTVASPGTNLNSLAMCDPAMGDPAMMMGDPAMGMGMNGSNNPYASTMNPYQSPSVDSAAISNQSLSSVQRLQRTREQEKIEKDSQIPLVSILLHSKHFLKYCDIAFEMVDTNGNGVVDDTELYAGLLLIHLKLGSFLGPAACKVSSTTCTD